MAQTNQNQQATKLTGDEASSAVNRLDYFVIGTIRELQDELKPVKSATEWKKRVAAFRDEHGLTDLQAIAVATCKLPVWQS